MNGVLLAIWCATCLCFPQNMDSAVFEPGFERKLDIFVQTTMDCRHVPGLTLAVVKDNETWTKGYGIADIPTQRPVTKDTLFNIGSVTKSFTMALLGVLLSERNMTWSTKVIDILGYEYEFTGEYRTRETTLKDLLSHRTGLARLDASLFVGISDKISRTYRAKQMRYLPEKKPFRDSYGYNNYMYMYLGHVCEVLGGDTWENLLQTRLLNPLGMTSTTVMKTSADVLTDEMAKPYIYKDDRFQNGTHSIYNLHPAEPSGAILSSGKDMIKWMQFLLNTGHLNNGTELVNKTLMQDAFQATSTTTYSDTSTEFMTKPAWPISMTPRGYGYALLISTYRGYKRVWHPGGLFSYISRMSLYPDRNAGVFVSTNGPAVQNLASWATETVDYYTSDGVLGLKPWLNGTTSCTFPKPWIADSKTPPTSTDTESKTPPTSNDTKSKTPPTSNDTKGKTLPTSNDTKIAIRNPSEYTGTYTHILFPEFNVYVNAIDSSKLVYKMNRISGWLHSTNQTDRFQMEIVLPFEFRLTDRNNNLIMMRVVFGRDERQITNVTIGFDVDVPFKRII